MILDIETRHRHVDGSTRWLRWNGYEREGQWFGTAQDVTASRTADMALRITERRARAILETLDEGLAILDETGTVIEANHVFAQIVGLPVNEVVGVAPPHPWWPAEEMDRLSAVMSRVMAGQEMVDELTIMRADGRRIQVLVSVASLPFERTGRALLAVIRDMTEVVAIHEQLLRAHRAAGIAVWEWYPQEDHLVVYGDGIRADVPPVYTLTNADAWSWVHDGATELRRLTDEMMAQRRDQFEADIRIHLEDGGSTAARVTAQPIVAPDGTVTGIRGTTRLTSAT